MKSQNALDLIRNDLVSELNLTALDVPTRTKAQYFRTATGRVFGLILGNLGPDGFDYQTVDILLEPCNLPVALHSTVMLVEQPYRGSSTYAPTKGVYLKDAQTRVRIQSEVGLRQLLTWYASDLQINPKTAAASITNIKVGQWSVSPVISPAETNVQEVLAKQEKLSQSTVVDLPPVPEKGLLIRDPWIEQILRGEKVWEMRSRGTNQRGWIALIKAGSGLVYGIARIEDCLGKLSDTQMLANHDKHGIPAERLGEVPNYRYAWVLADVQRLPKPVPYQHPSGAVIFANLDETVQAAIGAQLQK